MDEDRNEGSVTAVRALNSQDLADLRLALDDPREGTAMPVRAAAALRLGELKDVQSAGRIAQLTVDGVEMVRICAAKALEYIGSVETEDALVRCLSDESSSVRVAAAKALRKTGSSRAVEPLRPHLSDASVWMRFETAAALVQLRDTESADAIRIARRKETRLAYGRRMRWRRILSELARLEEEGAGPNHCEAE